MQWTFQPVGGPWFTATVAAVLLALVWVVPRPRPTGGRLWTLRGMRLATVLLTLVALLRPTLTRIETKPLEASLLLLVDRSRSMQVEDSLAGASRWAAARRMLADSAGALARLAEQWEVRAFAFDNGLTEAEVKGGVVALPEEPLGEATAIGATLEETLDRAGAERLLGVVLLSDGAQRALAPRDAAPQMAVRRLIAEGVPLYTATLGQPGVGGRADLAVEDLSASSSAFVKAPTAVTASLRVAGFAGRTFNVQLLWEDADGTMRVVNSTRVKTGPQGGAYPVRLEHTPLEPGERKLTVRVVDAAGGPPEGELVTSNNERSTFISIRDGGVNVLYLVGAQRPGGVPGREQRFARAALDASPDIAVTRRVFDYRRLRAGLRLDATQAPPDVLLIDNLDATALAAEAWRDIALRVRGGMGLAMIGGRQSFGPGGYAATPLARLLPVGCSAAERQRLAEPWRRDVHLDGPLTLRPAEPFGPSHPILQLGGADGPIDWAELPPLLGANRFNPRRLKANAMVLAEAAGAAGAKAPLLVVGQAGAGRVLASAVDSTWLWRLGGYADAHRRYWRQTVLWLAKKDDTTQNPVWVDLDSRLVPRGGRLDLRMGVRRNAQGQAAGAEGDAPELVRYDASVTTPSGKRIDLLTTTGPEATAVFADTAEPGDYTVRVIGLAGDAATTGGPTAGASANGAQQLGEAVARFSVPDQDLELDNPAAEPTLMAQLAAMTSSAGGRAIAPEELPDLLAEFADRDPELEEEVVSRVTYWDTWPFFLLLVGLLGGEWYLRKKWGLV
ncbi:MAG: hypothetical protein AAF790_00010 [Planctomycetota bacterium]